MWRTTEQVHSSREIERINRLDEGGERGSSALYSGTSVARQPIPLTVPSWFQRSPNSLQFPTRGHSHTHPYAHTRNHTVSFSLPLFVEVFLASRQISRTRRGDSFYVHTGEHFTACTSSASNLIFTVPRGYARATRKSLSISQTRALADRLHVAHVPTRLPLLRLDQSLNTAQLTPYPRLDIRRELLTRHFACKKKSKLRVRH